LDLAIDPAAPPEAAWRAELLGGVVAIRTAGAAADPSAWQGRLERPSGPPSRPRRVASPCRPSPPSPGPPANRPRGPSGSPAWAPDARSRLLEERHTHRSPPLGARAPRPQHLQVNCAILGVTPARQAAARKEAARHERRRHPRDQARGPRAPPVRDGP